MVVAVVVVAVAVVEERFGHPRTQSCENAGRQTTFTLHYEAAIGSDQKNGHGVVGLSVCQSSTPSTFAYSNSFLDGLLSGINRRTGTEGAEVPGTGSGQVFACEGLVISTGVDGSSYFCQSLYQTSQICIGAKTASGNCGFRRLHANQSRIMMNHRSLWV